MKDLKAEAGNTQNIFRKIHGTGEQEESVAEGEAELGE